MEQARWRRRYRAASITLPAWARDEPDRLVYGSNARGRWDIYAWDRASGAHRPLTDRPHGTRGGTLHPSGSSVWWFDDSKGNELGVWRVQPFDGGEATSAVPGLDPHYATGLAVASDFAVVGTSVRGAHRIHLARAGEAPVTLHASDKAAGVGSLNRTESLLALSHAEHTGDSRNRAVRVVDLDGKTVGELWDGPGRGLTAGAWSRVPGDARLIVLHERTGVRRPAIWDPVAGELTDLDVPALDGEVTAVWYPDASALLLTHERRGRTELYRYELASATVAPIPVEPGVISGARVRPDGDIWFAITTGSRPTEVRSLAGGVLMSPPGERAPEGVPYEDVDVGDVHALLAVPPGTGPFPTVFQVHGGPSGHDRHTFSPGVQAWIDHGFAVVMVNYRGSSGYGKAWRDTIVGRPGFMETEDIVAVRDHLAGRGVIDAARCILSGGSWGGYLTLFGLGTRPESWSLGISGVPLADLHRHYHEQSEPLRVYAHALFGGSPQDVPATFTDCSPLTYAESVRVPLMILAGENDPRCPIGQVNAYVERMEELDKDVEVYRYDAGHGTLVMDETIRQMEMRIDFAARKLGTPKPE